MNFRQPNEDLFDSTRMSFGEHLEELRKVLVRGLIGVAIGCVVGFLFATQTIQVLKQPLVDAIKAYKIEDASAEMVKRYGYIPPEYLTWMAEGFVPKQIKFDPREFAKSLPSLFPNAELEMENHGFKTSEFEPRNIPKICKRLSAQTNLGPATKAKLIALWDVMPESDQTVIKRIAGQSEATDQDVADVIEAINRLARNETIKDTEAFQSDLVEGQSGFWEMFAPETPKPLAKMKERLDEEPDEALNSRLNRALITSQFVDLMPTLKTDLVTIEIFEDLEFEPQALGVGEGFGVWLKAGLFTGLVIAGPWLFIQIWSFVATGLYPHEKKHMHMFLPISIFLFVAGVLLAFFFVFEPVLQFLFSFNRSMGIDPQMRINEWLSFVMFLPLGFGIAFQLPLVMLFMNRIGLFSVEAYLSKWRIAVMVIFFLAMMLTPADPISMLLLAIPLTILYFLGIGMCQWMPKVKNPFGEDVAPST